MDNVFLYNKSPNPIELAKARGVLPEIKYPEQFENVYNDWKCGKIKGVDAIKALGLKKTTF